MGKALSHLAPLNWMCYVSYCIGLSFCHSFCAQAVWSYNGWQKGPSGIAPFFSWRHVWRRPRWILKHVLWQFQVLLQTPRLKMGRQLGIWGNPLALWRASQTSLQHSKSKYEFKNDWMIARWGSGQSHVLASGAPNSSEWLPLHDVLRTWLSYTCTVLFPLVLLCPWPRSLC